MLTENKATQKIWLDLFDKMVPELHNGIDKSFEVTCKHLYSAHDLPPTTAGVSANPTEIMLGFVILTRKELKGSIVTTNLFFRIQLTLSVFQTIAES